MPRLAMLYAYTINAAKAMMAEKSIGSLVPGKSADIIMLDRDILTVHPKPWKKPVCSGPCFKERKCMKPYSNEMDDKWFFISIICKQPLKIKATDVIVAGIKTFIEWRYRTQFLKNNHEQTTDYFLHIVDAIFVCTISN